MATVSPDLVGLEHDEDERDVDNRERNPLRRQADYSRSALLGAHVFNPAREKLLRELRKSIEKKDDAEAERDKLERDNKLQEIVVKEPRLDTPRGQSESSSEKKTAVLSSVGHMSEVGDVPEDPTPTHEDSPPAQDAAAFVEDPEHGAVESEWTDETDSEPDKPEHSTPRAEVVRVAVRYPPSKTRMSE
ncbi:MAG: uncharacterized protein KVP18_004540 [Porospora cf. gigantea A]|nr:MAG: hypothetical protein KVP18_004540 [Porospora cf. gigantea A]